MLKSIFHIIKYTLFYFRLLKEILYKTEEDCQAVVFNKDGTWTPKIINGI